MPVCHEPTTVPVQQTDSKHTLLLAITMQHFMQGSQMELHKKGIDAVSCKILQTSKVLVLVFLKATCN